LAIFLLIGCAASVSAQTPEGEAGWTLYPPTTPTDISVFCDQQLRYAEAEVAKLLTSFDYSLMITATGKSGPFEGASCALESVRTVETKTKVQGN
jgi:hypothetical protein